MGRTIQVSEILEFTQIMMIMIMMMMMMMLLLLAVVSSIFQYFPTEIG